jgi:hypothetical protein
MTAAQAGRRDWTRPSLLLGLVTFVIHVVFNGGYGVFRDERSGWKGA